MILFIISISLSIIKISTIAITIWIQSLGEAITNLRKEFESIYKTTIYITKCSSNQSIAFVMWINNRAHTIMDTKKETGKETIMSYIFYYISIGITVTLYCVMGIALQLDDILKQAIMNIIKDINEL